MVLPKSPLMGAATGKLMADDIRVRSLTTVPLIPQLNRLPQPLKPIFHCNENYLASGVGVGQCPQHQYFAFGIPTCCILEPTQTLKFALPPTPNPNASQWNIGVVGTQCKMFTLAMYISCFLCRFHLRLVANANTVLSEIWALGLYKINIITIKARTHMSDSSAVPSVGIYSSDSSP